MSSSTWSRASSSLRNSGLDPVVSKHLRRVYGALLQVCGAAAIGSTAQMYLQWNNQFLGSMMVFASLLYFMYLPSHSPRRHYAFLACGFSKGWALGPLLSLATIIRPGAVQLALVGAATVFGALSVSATYAQRRQYLYLGGFCASALSLMSLFSLVAVFWRGLAMSDFYLGLQLYGGLLVFSGYVLYDTSLIIEKAAIGERDYLQHALTLFVNLVAIFVRLLIILIRNSERREREERRKRRDD